MKTPLSVLAFAAFFLPGTCSAFVVNSSGGNHNFGVKHGSRFASPAIYNARVDSSEAVADALRISKQKGTSSPEAEWLGT